MKRTGKLDRLDRRTLLKGAGGVALALPMLEAMQPRTAHGQGGGPVRFMFVSGPNGTIESRSQPTGGERDFTLGQLHQPLVPHQQDIVVFRGINNISYGRSSGGAHPKGTGTQLTGRPLSPGNRAGSDGGGGGGISVDQEMASHDHVVGQTPFRSLELGVQSTRGGPAGHVSWAGANQAVPRENDPFKVFDRLFQNGGGGNANPGDADRIRLERKSVLDFVMGDLTRMSTRISREDRLRLDLHTVAIRDAEMRLQNAPAPLSCDSPNIQRGNLAVNEIFALQMDLMVLAASCDLTRVTTLQFGYGAYREGYPWLGEGGNHHGISHKGDNDQGAVASLTKINTWHAEMFAYLIDKLKNTPDGQGTLLDNVVAMWQNELTQGNQHRANNLPTVLAGSAGGKIETGRFLNFPNRISNQALLVSLLQAMGVQANTFGAPQSVDGPLPGLVG